MPAPRPLCLQNPSGGRQIRAASGRSMGSRIAPFHSRVAPQALRVAPKVRVSSIRRQHSFTGLRAEPHQRSRTALSTTQGSAASSASAFPLHRRRGMSGAAAAVTSASGTSGPAVDVLGRRRSSHSSSKGEGSRARRQRCLPACFLPDKTPPSQCSDRSESLFAGQSMTLPFHGGGPAAPTVSQGVSAMKSATALVLSSTAASLLLLLPVGLPGSPELAQAAPESTLEGQAAEVVSFSQDVAAFSEVLQDSESLEGVTLSPPQTPVEESSGTDNLGFLSLDSEPSASGSFSDAAASDTAPQEQEQVAADTASRRPTPVLSDGDTPAFAAGSAQAPLDDTCVPLTEELHAALAAERPSVSPPASPRRVSPAPAIYTPSTTAQDSAASGGSSAGLLVPVSAAAAAATFSAASPGAAALVETSATAQAIMSAVPAAKEAAVAVAEPVIAGAAAATEAVAAAAATVAEPVVATAAAAAASASSGLSAKLSLILAQSLQHLGVGGVAGAVGATVVYPLDTVKTRMQAQTSCPSKKSSKEGEHSDDGPGEDAGLVIRSQSGEHQVRVMRSDLPEPYKNEFDCMYRMVREEGVTSLYSGLGAQLVGIAPEKAVKLTVNEVLLAILEALMPGTRVWMLELIAGGGGGACQVVFTNPVEAVKVRLQAARPQAGGDLEAGSEGSHSAEGASGGSAATAGFEGRVGEGDAHGRAREGLLASASSSGASADMAGTGTGTEASKHHHHQQHHPDTMQVVQELGLKGLYTGSTLTLARDVPSTALFFASYAYLTQPDQQERFLAAASCLSPFVYVFLAACVSSIPASVLVTPFDVVKTRMQIQHASNGTGRAPTAMEVAKQLVVEEGPMALFKGGMARALRVGPQLGITLMTYDWLCKNW